MILPRNSPSFTARPVRARAAVAPSPIINSGLMVSISRSSHWRQASISLLRGRFMHATLAARLPFEMLDGIGNVEFGAIEAGVHECTVKYCARGTDERMPFQIFDIAGLLANQDGAGARVAFAEYGLGGIAPQRASGTVLRL